MTTEEKFQAAVNVMKNLPQEGPFQASNEMKLKFYGHYKQATKGPCKQARPGFWDPINRAKHDAWASMGHMDTNLAMEGYVKLLSQIVETMNLSEDVETFMEVLGPFYDYVEDKISPVKESKQKIGDKTTILMDNGMTSSSCEELDNMLGRFPTNLPNYNSIPRTVSSSDVGSVTLNSRKIDMNHNCFVSSSEDDITEKDNISEEDDILEEDDIHEKDEIIEELINTSQEIQIASDLLHEIKMSLNEDGEENERYNRDSSADSRSVDTVIHKSLPTSEMEESDEEIFEDSIEHAQDTPLIHGKPSSQESSPDQGTNSQSSVEDQTTSSQDVSPGAIPSSYKEISPGDHTSSYQARQEERRFLRSDESMESYYLEGDTPSLPDPRGAGGAIPRNGGATHRSRAMPTTSLPSSPLYPEEELVVYSSGGSQPSRILMRPIDSQVHRYNQSLMQRLEGNVELVNSNLTHLTSRLEMMTGSLEHMTARLGSMEANFEQVHARINTMEYLMQVLISREESRLISRSNLTAVSLVTCAALILAKVFSSRKS